MLVAIVSLHRSGDFGGAGGSAASGRDMPRKFRVLSRNLVVNFLLGVVTSVTRKEIKLALMSLSSFQMDAGIAAADWLAAHPAG